MSNGDTGENLKLLNGLCDRIQQLDGALSSATRFANDYMQGNAQAAEPSKQLWTQLTKYGYLQNEDAGRYFSQIEEAQRQLEALRDPLIANFHSNFHNEIANSIRTNYQYIQQREVKLSRARATYETHLRNMDASSKKAKKNHEMFNTKMQELLRAKKEYETMAYTLIGEGNTLNQNQYLSVVESVLSLLEAQYTYFGQGYAILHEYLQSWRDNLIKLKGQLPTAANPVSDI